MPTLKKISGFGKQKSTNNKKKVFKIKINFWTIVLGVLTLLFFLPLLFSFFGVDSFEDKIEISQVLNDIKEEKIDKVEIQDERLLLYYKDDSFKTSIKEDDQRFSELLENSGIDPSSVNYEVVDQSLTKILGELLGIILPVILMAAVFFFIIRSQSKGAQDIFSFGKSRAKLFAKGKQNVNFGDVAGVEEAKKELEEVVDFLKNPAKYRKIGARTPKGVLLVGPSGVGKTLLARAVAGQASVPFFSMAGSEFMEMLVGVGASRCRDLFAQAKSQAPSIIFIDEIDAIGRQRGRGLMGGHDEREQTLNQILVEMDGFTPNDRVVVIAASVTGDTPVLIKKNGKVKLLPIGDLIDVYYKNKDEEGEIPATELKCLSFERKLSSNIMLKNNLYLNNSAFKSVSSVFRHKVKEIYEIDYLGGKIRATGNHSVFVRTTKGLETRAVSDLKPGDILVNLPYKVNRTKKDMMEIRGHKFSDDWKFEIPLECRETTFFWQQKYQYALAAYHQGISQERVANEVGVSQGTIGNWVRGVHIPREISRKYTKFDFEKVADEIEVTPEFCRLLGYYTAEGYSRWELDFCFSIKETKYIKDVIDLMEKYFKLTPKLRRITPNAVNITYHSAAPVSKIFARYCGVGAKNKHIPPFLFEAQYPYFKEYLRGLWRGDGYEDKHGRGEITTVSKQLAMEINWLARMHGIKTYLGGFTTKGGRRINGGKPLKAVRAWRVGWGKGANPFTKHPIKKKHAYKRPIVKSVKKVKYSGFVYDLCGVDNEAFFGGESPILLHNTNRGDLLDPALLRPGRFDRRVVLDMPDKEGREAILKIHARGKKFTKGIKWERVADRTVGFSGADLENMLNEAAILAARENKSAIEDQDIEEAATKVKLGPAKKRLQSEEDKKITAYHEAGHAIVTHNLPKMDPVHRISIVARGMSLGHTLIPPAADRTHETKSRITEQITAMLGGRAAEDVVFGEMTSGAANDIERATQLSRAMVMEFGMSELGPVNLGPQMDIDEFGKTNWYEPSNISQAMQEKVDTEVKKILDSSYKQAVLIIKKQRKILDKVSKALLKTETLDREQFEKIVGKKK